MASPQTQSLVTAYQANLYTHTQPNDNLGADVLVPNNLPDGTVNVHYNYCWTLSEEVVRNYVPYIELTEYRQVLSSEISGFLYNLAGYVDNINVAANTIPTTVSAVGSIGAANVKRALSSVSNIPNTNLINNATNSVITAMNSVSPQTLSRVSKDNPLPNDRNSNPYNGLYAVQPTKWKYILPFLTGSNMVSPANSWGEPSGKIKEIFGGLKNFINPGAGTGGAPAPGQAAGTLNISTLIKDVADLTQLPLAATAGAVIQETPKSFLGTNTDKVTVSFYLFNTKEYSDIQKNWEFCYLFTYQNLPNRKGVNLLDPPCLYRVLIPGYKQLPLCYISSLNIENVGSVRLVDIITGTETFGDKHVSSPNIKMIPEAYKITFTLESVLLNARNIFSYTEDPSKNITVTTVQ